MRNIFKIFFADVKRISTNVVAVVVILGLCILPSLYAWFNILSNWDPYGPSATRNLKIAVASDDEGVTILGNSVNVGSSVISALESNTTMGWVFTDTTDEAIDGVYDGSYYAALIIPENFTEDMISFLGGEMGLPDIIYYESQEKRHCLQDHTEGQDGCAGAGKQHGGEYPCRDHDEGDERPLRCGCGRFRSGGECSGKTQ